MLTPNGGVFGRNPKFQNVTVENNLIVNGDFTLGDDIVINDTLLVNGVATFKGGIISTGTAAAPTSNTVLGTTAGAALQSGATDNVLLGATAGDSITTGDQCIVIGSGADVAAATNSNSIVIGHGAVGNGSNTTTIGNSSTTGTFIPAGNLTLTNGNFIVGTSGKGIDFSATSDGTGTMTSELLSDYEEGTWTPNLEFNGVNVSMTYTTQAGSYTKIGRMVHVTGVIVLSNKGTSTGHATVTFPFTIANDANADGAFPVWVSAVTYSGSIMPALLSNNNRGYLYEVTEAGVLSTITEADFSNTSEIRFTATFRV